jgi:hypothetical protein
MAVDPRGMPGTRMTRDSPLSIRAIVAAYNFMLPMLSLFASSSMRHTSVVAGDIIYAAFDEEHLGQRPKTVYLSARDEEVPNVGCKDEAKAKELWMESLELAKVTECETTLEHWQ